LVDGGKGVEGMSGEGNVDVYEDFRNDRAARKVN
jgi:hypothetical protein